MLRAIFVERSGRSKTSFANGSKKLMSNNASQFLDKSNMLCYYLRHYIYLELLVTIKSSLCCNSVSCNVF